MIKRVAANAKVHAFILEGASKRELRRYVADPAVRSVSIADVDFDLTPHVVELHYGSRGPRVP